MKIFKISKTLWLAGIGLLSMASCTKEFKTYNTNPNAITEAQLRGDGEDVGGFFPDMEQSVMRIVTWEYQVQQNLNADLWSGYMMSADPFGANNNTSYALNDGWDTYPFDEANNHIMANWLQVYKRARTSNPTFYAIALIIKVEGMHRVTDAYGPIPYSKFATASINIPYDSQQDVYNRFFAELDTAVNNLTTAVTANPNDKTFAPYDYIYNGNYTKWIKFANTLRLRLAMHIVYADAATAKTQAEKACANSYGLLSTVDDQALVNITSTNNYTNPFNVITTSWGDISMGATLQSVLDGYNDPREAKYALKSTLDPSKYLGIRLGVSYNVSYAGFSELGIQPTEPLRWMSASESYFLRAEGALRGWNMGAGTAQSFYEQGVALAFSEKGATMPSNYLTDNTSIPGAYIDPQNSKDNVPAGSPYLNNITIAWNNGDTFEHSLQRIMTQKWIAMFPDGQEAWTEYRRTGYPVQFPVVNNNSGGAISSIPGIRRLPFPADEVSNNAAQVQKAISLLGGPDNGNTKLWWDKNPNH